jgi:hypothetical protein
VAALVGLDAAFEGSCPTGSCEPSPDVGGPDGAPPETADDAGLAIGLAEQNPHLIGVDVPAAFAPWRDRAVALRPKLFRLLVDWSKVQPAPDAPPDWAAVQDGCVRGRAPCAPYGGVRDLLRAVRARQRADGGWHVVASPYGAPGWARTPRAGCPAGGTIDLAAYRAFVRSLAGLARAEGIEVVRWSPWNEPNHPTFLAPQRAACGRDRPARSPAAYADLVRALRAELPDARLLLGEVAGYAGPRRDRLGAAEFAAALPREVVCASELWAQHTYVGKGTTALAADRDAAGNTQLVDAVTRALDAHRCPAEHGLWISETGAVPGPRACRQMDAALRAWEAAPRVAAAIQYTFREDPLFRVGLADAGLQAERGAYRPWLARAGGDGVPSDPCPT